MTTAMLSARLCNPPHAIGYALAKLLAAELAPPGISFLRSARVLAAAAGLSARLPVPVPGWTAAWAHATLAGAILITLGGLLLPRPARPAG